MTDKKKKNALDLARIIAKRAKQAEALAQSPTTTVTLRIPTALNEWLTEYQHLSYPSRITKGRLVIEGLMLSYLKRGRPGEKILSEDEALGISGKTKK